MQKPKTIVLEPEDLELQLLRYIDGVADFPPISGSDDLATCVRLAKIDRLLVERAREMREAEQDNVGRSLVPVQSPDLTPALASPARVRGSRKLGLAMALTAAVAFAFLAYFAPSLFVPGNRDKLLEVRAQAIDARMRASEARQDYLTAIKHPSDLAKQSADTAEVAKANGETAWRAADDVWNALERKEKIATDRIDATWQHFVKAKEHFLAADAGYRSAAKLGSAKMLIAALIEIKVYGKDKECGEVVLRLQQGQTWITLGKYGNGIAWTKSTPPQTDEIALSLPLTGEPLSIEAALEERPPLQVDIDAELQFDVSLKTNYGDSIKFSGKKRFETDEGQSTTMLTRDND